MGQTLERGGAVVGSNFVPDTGTKFNVLNQQTVVEKPEELVAEQSSVVSVDPAETILKPEIITPELETVPQETVVEQPTTQNETSVDASRRAMRDAREKINPWSVPTEAVARLQVFINRVDKKDFQNDSVGYRKKKTPLLNLEYEIEDEKNPEVILSKIAQNESLSDDEKKELSALVKGETATIQEENQAPEVPQAEVVPTTELEVVSQEVAVDTVQEVIAESDQSVQQVENTLQETEAVVPVEPEVVIEKAPELSEEQLKENLAQAREAYAGESVKYKNALREKKSAFRKVMTDLGFPGKQMPEIDKSPEFLQAEKNYIEAKKQLRLKMVGGGEYKAEQAMQQAEGEYEKLQRKIVETLPPLEKGIVTKSFEKWARLPLHARVALSTALITAIGVGAGTIGIVGIANAAGWRAVRSFGGGIGSQITGRKKGEKYGKESQERTQEALKNYAGTFDPEKFEDQERKLMEFFEGEENQKKRDRLKKAGWMVATGAGVSVGLGELHQAISHLSVPSTPIDQVRTVPKMVDAIRAPIKAPVEIEPVKVELSSRGYIDTFSKLQQDLAEKYPNVNQTPPEVAEILDSTPEKLAIKFGFYKPTSEFESAFGMKGDHLIFDKSGNLILENAKGTQTIFDAKTGTVHEYSGKMMDAETGRISSDVSHTDTGNNQIVSEGNTKPVGDVISEAPKEGLTEMAVNGATLTENVGVLENIVGDTAVIAGEVATQIGQDVLEDKATSGKLFSWNGEPRAEVSMDFIPTDIALGKAPILEQFQFGKEGKEARRQYNIMFEKMAMRWPEGTVDYRLPIEYQGGRIQVLEKGDELTVLLNGKKIGTGKIISGGVGMQYESSLGKGMLGVKNDYELAFEKAKEVVNKKVNLFIRKA